MFEARFTTIGDTQTLARLSRRMGTAEIQRGVFDPWMRAVQARRLEMYKLRGAVDGNPAWAANAPRTIEAKGHDRPLLSARLYQFGAMVRSYVIKQQRHGLRAWSFTMTNTARSRKGYDYPSALHEGRGPYAFGKGTHPGYPARRHMGFLDADQRDLWQKRIPAWVNEGRKLV